MEQCRTVPRETIQQRLFQESINNSSSKSQTKLNDPLMRLKLTINEGLCHITFNPSLTEFQTQTIILKVKHCGGGMMAWDCFDASGLED